MARGLSLSNGALRRGLSFLVPVFVPLLALLAWAIQPAGPAEVAEDYLKAAYAGDYARAYDFISLEDRRHKTREAYVAENGPLQGFALVAARALARHVRLEDVRVTISGDRATVEARVMSLDGNASGIREIVFAQKEDPDLTLTERRRLFRRLERLIGAGQVPRLENEVALELRRREGRWGVYLGWAEAIPVRFTAAIKDGLPFEFRSLQEVVLARPGETLRAAYHVKNLSDRPVTAKADHSVEPEGALDTVQCFCFIQLTLQPGEEQELPVVFRVKWDLPEGVKSIRNHYDFYPLESFPGRQEP